MSGFEQLGFDTVFKLLKTNSNTTKLMSIAAFAGFAVGFAKANAAKSTLIEDNAALVGSLKFQIQLNKEQTETIKTQTSDMRELKNTHNEEIKQLQEEVLNSKEEAMRYKVLYENGWPSFFKSLLTPCKTVGDMHNQEPRARPR